MTWSEWTVSALRWNRPRCRRADELNTPDPASKATPARYDVRRERMDALPQPSEATTPPVRAMRAAASKSEPVVVSMTCSPPSTSVADACRDARREVPSSTEPSHVRSPATTAAAPRSDQTRGRTHETIVRKPARSRQSRRHAVHQPGSPFQRDLRPAKTLVRKPVFRGGAMAGFGDGIM